MTLEHSKRKHSEFSPSSAKRWMSCPGSVRLARLAPPQRGSVYAREGTDAHECLEFIVKRFKDRAAAAVEASKKYPADMVGHAMTSAERIFSKDLRPSPTAELLVETRVVVPGIRRLYGTLDYAWVDLWGKLVIADYKYGAGVAVFPVEDGEPNPQLMLYALGIAAKHHFDFENVTLAILAPRMFAGADALLKETVTIKALKEFGREVGEAVKRASAADAPLVAGDHCRWCPANATCPENSKSALEKAHIAFDIDTGIQAAPAPLALTPEKLPRVLDACTQLENWIKAVREHAYRLADDGAKIPGYKLVAKRAQRIWLPEAVNAARKSFGEDAFETERKFLSPAQLEKKLGASGKAFAAQFTSAISSGFNLVPEKDARSEITSTAVFDFES